MKTKLMVLLSLALLACGSDDGAFSESSSSGQGATGAGAGASQGGGPAGSGGEGVGASGTGGDGTGGAGAAGGAGGGPVADPNLPGPHGIAELDDAVAVPSTGNTVAIHAAYPSDGAGPFPIVLLGHGFQLPPTQYYSYLQRLASHGFVALTVDFVAGLFSPNNINNATELLAGIDWAVAHPTLGPLVDGNNVGTTGHSLGGKVAFLAASMDARVKAAITLDPVDGAMNCSPTNCPDVSAQMPPIPTGVIGETTDAAGGFQPCAPAADNFATFFAGAASPALSVEVLGANHMSFLDDQGSCGFTCSFCNAASVADQVVGDLSRAYLVAFFERYLQNDAGYDLYLTGAEADARYVQTGMAVVNAK